MISIKDLRKADIIKFPIGIVVWDDSYAVDAWTHTTQTLFHEESIKSIGHIAQAGNSVLVFHSISDHQYCKYLRIPKSAVIEFEIISEAQ